MTPPTIEARGLTQRYHDGTLALDDLSLSVAREEIYCLVGSPGAGKTTVFDLFLAGGAPTAGQALIGGLECRGRPLAVRRLAMFVSRAMAFHADTSARANVRFFARLTADTPVTPRAVDDALRQAGLPERNFDTPVRDLSRGFAVQLWLAVSLVRRPYALLLDDPTAGLDDDASREVCDGIAACRSAGSAVLVMTSDAPLAARIADRIAALEHGRKIDEHGRTASASS